MKQLITLFLFIFLSLFTNAQIGLPIQQSVLPKNSLVVNYDFSKSASFTRGGSTVTNIAGTASGNASIVNSPIFFNSLGFVSLNGINQYVVTPNLRTYFKTVNTSVQTSFTISFWVYPTATSGNLIYELGSQTPDFGWNASNIEIINGYVKYRVWNLPSPWITSTTTVNLNQWYHIAMVYDGATVKGYLNGVLQGTQTGTRTIPTGGQFYAIGAGGGQNMGTNVYGKFNVAQFKIYNLPFSDSDILQEYNLRKDELDYLIHSPATNTNPTYWSVSGSYANDGFGTSHYTPWLNSNLGWAAVAGDFNQWITLNYDEPTFIKGVVIQPRASSYNQFVTKVHVETSMTGAAPWTRIVSDVPISTTITDDGRVLFPTSIFAKSVRVIPVTWINFITMRMGMLVKPNNLITNGLVLRLDAANLKSYGGTGATIWNDLSANAYNGTLNGPLYNSGNGGHFVLDGVDDLVTGVAIPSTSGNNSRTVMVWYKSTANRNTILIDKGALLDNTAEQLFVASTNGVGDGSGSTSPPINTGGIYIAFWGNDIFYPVLSSTLFDGNWHFVAYTYNNSNRSVQVCFDGTFASSVYQWISSWTTNNSKPFVLPNNLNTTNNPLWIGQARAQMWGKGGVYANASIPFVYMYNRSLSESEILNHYNASKNRYNIVEFKSVGVTTWTVPAGVTSIEYLIVGGGGGGGNGFDNGAGGGGGGGMVLTGTLSVTPGTNLNITVGDGGLGGANVRADLNGSNGNNSNFSSIIALGGQGGRASRTFTTAGQAGLKQVTNTISATGGQGGNVSVGGGGGGATADGTGRIGGLGFTSSISGLDVIYGNGGNGAQGFTNSTGNSGSNNTGQGGGAGSAVSSSSAAGGKGGSGVVILKLNY